MTAREFGPEVDGNPPPPAARADRAHSFAIVVGIDRYPGFSDLLGACNDATAFHQWVVDPGGGGVPETNARLRLSGRARTVGGAKPLKREIDRDLHEFVAIARSSPAPTRLYLFFAGHGMAPLQSTAAGVMANATKARCWNLSFTTYLTWFQRCRDFTEVVLLSDCCRTLLDGPAGAPQHDKCSAGPHPTQSTLVAHATDVDQRAFEDRSGEGLVRGFFTSALIDGLRGAAVDPESGEVHATGLAAYLDREVRERSTHRQYPRTENSYPPLVLAALPPIAASAVRVTILLTPSPPRDVQILDGTLTEIYRVTTAAGELALDLRNGLYEVRDPAVGQPCPFRVEGVPVQVDARPAGTGG